MFVIEKRVRFDAQLPATPCTPEMRKRIQELAQREGMSMAEIQRAALSLFLSAADNSVISDTNPVSEAQPS